MDVDELDTLEEHCILDVRGADEYDAGHIPGAHRLAASRVVWNSDQLPTDRQIIIYCASGRRAAIGASALRRKGFNIVELNGDFGSWAAVHDNIPAIVTG